MTTKKKKMKKSIKEPNKQTEDAIVTITYLNDVVHKFIQKCFSLSNDIERLNHGLQKFTK